MRLSDRAQFLVDNLDLPEAAQVEDARWEHFQLAHLSDDSMFRVEVKSRQIAWSFTIAAEAIANAVLYGISSIFQSINREEAEEKIVYARRVLRNLRIGGLPRIARPDTLTSIGFENDARIISVPGTPHRGKAKFWVYFDEWAHQQYDRQNYRAAQPIITKGGVIRGASSPLGASGLFWEIYTESMQKFPDFSRKRTPWWEIYAFCTDVPTARREAPGLTTAERVERFGNERIKLLFANSILEDFQAEYETDFVDEILSWITWGEIKNIQDVTLLCRLSTDTGGIERAKQAVDTLAQDCRTGKIEAALGAGYDVGRTRNTSELYLVGQSTTNTYPLRGAITLDNCEFDDQYELLIYAMTKLPIVAMLIDRNGLGMNLAENMERKYPSKAIGVDFTNANKNLLATDAKLLAQQKKVPLPVNRDMAYQIHSIKKLVTAAKNVIFDTERNEKHHADKFWAWALALAAIRRRISSKVVPGVIAQAKAKGW